MELTGGVGQVETQTDIVERKEEKSSLLVYDSDTDTGTDDDTPAGSASRAFKVQAGCLLLLEAYSDFPSTCPKHQCPMVSAVPKSKPPRWYSTKDKVHLFQGFWVQQLLKSACAEIFFDKPPPPPRNSQLPLVCVCLFFWQAPRPPPPPPEQSNDAHRSARHRHDGQKAMTPVGQAEPEPNADIAR